MGDPLGVKPQEMNARLKGTHPGGSVGKKGKRVTEREDSLQREGERCETRHRETHAERYGERVRNAMRKLSERLEMELPAGYRGTHR